MLVNHPRDDVDPWFILFADITKVPFFFRADVMAKSFC
jgi:hypothetical protein